MSSVDAKPPISARATDAIAPAGLAGIALEHWALIVGALALAIPTMMSVAKLSWSTEQGAHGPIMLATGIWLIGQRRREIAPLVRPGNLALSIALLLATLTIYVVARVTDTLELEGPAMYAALVICFYAYCGSQALRLLWFPIFYLLFVFPPPDSVLAMLTQPLKLQISRLAVDLLDMLGYPVGRTGVVIQVAQYDVLVAAACAGLNSIISLSAIGLFYVYVRHNANWRYALLLMLVILPMAIVANFIRVLLIILMTYYFGDAVAQGFLHEFAGLTMFLVALLGIIGFDILLQPLRRRLGREAA
jgi:exosortase